MKVFEKIKNCNECPFLCESAHCNLYWETVDVFYDKKKEGMDISINCKIKKILIEEDG